MGTYEAFGALLREALRAAGWNAAEVARRLDINRATVNRWVNGYTIPEREIIVPLADCLGIHGAARQRLFSVYFGDE